MNNDLNDLVKRGAVCDMLHEEMGAWGNCADEIEALLKANDALWKIPAVDAVEVVHGEWINLTECANEGVYCSVCHKKVYRADYAWCVKKNKVRSNYCPNCGADMREREGDDEAY